MWTYMLCITMHVDYLTIEYVATCRDMSRHMSGQTRDILRHVSSENVLLHNMYWCT